MHTIKNVTVIGAGQTGVQIAFQLVNAGLKVLLIDKKPECDPEKALHDILQEDPSLLYSHKDLSNIQTGDVHDDMHLVEASDWIILTDHNSEVSKKLLLEAIEKHRKSGTLVSDTSFSFFEDIYRNCSEDFRHNFFRICFAYPPRHTRLLEIIPGPETNPLVPDHFTEFAENVIGKTVLIHQGTSFLINDLQIFRSLKVFQLMNRYQLDVDETDRLTGKITGCPKGVFQIIDLLGQDVFVSMAEEFLSRTKDDLRIPEYFRELQKRNLPGFYSEADSRVRTLDLKDFTYKKSKKARFKTVGKARKADPAKKYKILISGKDKAGCFFKELYYALFSFVSEMVPDASKALYLIDMVMRDGLNQEKGLFEIWDQLGPAKHMSEMENAGCLPASWVVDMLQRKIPSFYSNENGYQYYDLHSGAYTNIPLRHEEIILDIIRPASTLWENEHASIIHLGDGILNLEFRTDMNVMDEKVFEGFHQVIDMAEKEFRGVVIGHQGTNFTVGVNLGTLFMYIIEQDFKGLEKLLERVQTTFLRARYSDIPVVTAPFGLSLGGGCELSLHADGIQAYAETNIGLPEIGIGILPSGGGTKEMARKASNDPDFRLRAFRNIITAKISASAKEALDMGILSFADQISINKKHVLNDAKNRALGLVEKGYTRPKPIKIPVPGNTGKEMLLEEAENLLTSQSITKFEAYIAGKIASVMCGGDLSTPKNVSEQYMLDLEKEAFLSLCGERKTLERIHSVLLKGKRLRN